MTVRVKLPGGTLKIKRYQELRRYERERKVPVWRLGSTYFTWWSTRLENQQARQPKDVDRANET